MTDPFIIKLVLSFVVGSLWITMGTILAERFGTKAGGLVAGLPSTILVSLLFIAWTQSESVATEATTIIPAVHGINALFVVVYIFLLRFNFWVALTVSLGVWFVLSMSLIAIGFHSFPLALVLYVCLVILTYQIVEKTMYIPSERGRKIRYTLSLVIVRGCFSGAIILLSVVLAKVSGPLVGGVFSVFPTMFVGLLLITYFSHGSSFSAAVMKASIPGAISVVVYATSVRYTYMPLGIWLGTLLSFIVSLFASVCIHRFMVRRTS